MLCIFLCTDVLMKCVHCTPVEDLCTLQPCSRVRGRGEGGSYLVMKDLSETIRKTTPISAKFTNILMK